VTGTSTSVRGLVASLPRRWRRRSAESSKHPWRILASRVRYAAPCYGASHTRSTSARCPSRSSSLPFMVDGTLDAGSRGADVELRRRAARGSHSPARGCSPRRSANRRPARQHCQPNSPAVRNVPEEWPRQPLAFGRWLRVWCLYGALVLDDRSPRRGRRSSPAESPCSRPLRFGPHSQGAARRRIPVLHRPPVAVDPSLRVDGQQTGG